MTCISFVWNLTVISKSLIHVSAISLMLFSIDVTFKFNKLKITGTQLFFCKVIHFEVKWIPEMQCKSFHEKVISITKMRDCIKLC